MLACADSAEGNSGVAAELGLSVETVRKWRSRFTESGTAGLADAPRPGRRKADLVLTGAEREQLARWARRGKTSQVLALRAKIVLACADGRENKAVAAELRTSEHNVARWRGRFIAGRLGGLARREAPRPAAVDPAGQGRGGRHRHPGGAAPGRDALVAGLDGPAQRPVGVHGRPDLAEVRPEAAPHRRVQAVDRPAVRGEGRRRRRPLPQPAGEGRGAVRGREVGRSRPWTGPSRCCR